MKKKGRLVVAFAAVWIILVYALKIAEQRIPGSQISAFSDAFWYSLVTLSTVGYGDLVPLSTAGRFIGGIFVLLGTCAFALLIGMAISALSGKLLVPLRIRLSGAKNKYVFREWNEQSRLLLTNIVQEDPKALAIVLQPIGNRPEGVDAVALEAEPERAVRLASHGKGKVSVFLMDESQAANIEAAERLSPLNVPVYCRTDGSIPWKFPNVVFFCPQQCCARRYWQEYPVEQTRQSIVLVGSGKLCAQILLQALLVNVLDEAQELVYHVTGAMEDFVREHTQLAHVCAINSLKDGNDAVFFHGVPWNALQDVLLKADRIILCEDDDAQNLDNLIALRECLTIKAPVHVKMNLRSTVEQFFGREEEIYTPQYVMKERLNELARRMHEIYRESTGGNAAAWEELSAFTQASNIAVADHVLTKVRLLLPGERLTELTPQVCQKAYEAYERTKEAHCERYRRIEHERWMRFHELRNWTWAPTRNNEAREHPLLCRFEELSPAEQEKDDYAWEILREIGSE